MEADGLAGSCIWRRCVGQWPGQASVVHRGCGEPPRADWRDSFGGSGGWSLGRGSSGQICEDRFSIARRAESPRDATEGRCWVEPSIADSSIHPRLAKAKPKGPGPAASGVVAWSSGSAPAVGVARPASRGASSGGISVRQRLGEAEGSANESCRRGFREIPQKPSVFAPDEVFASDRTCRASGLAISVPQKLVPVRQVDEYQLGQMRPVPDQCRRLGHQRKEFIIVNLTNRHTGLGGDDNVADARGYNEVRRRKGPGRYPSRRRQGLRADDRVRLGWEAWGTRGGREGGAGPEPQT